MAEHDLKDLVIPKERLTLHKEYVFGRGAFGYVCLAIHEKDDGQLEKVAAKMMITEGNIPDSVKKCLVKEACKLREVAVHDNIVKLIGVLMETDNYGIILELMVFGDCLSFIKDYTVVWPENKLLIQLCEQVCSAMDYLHRLTPPMLHMDLKADNILIDNHFDAKIGDFGIAEWKTRTTRQGRLGTITHIAPEILNNVNIRSTMAQDVYSFGICLWEIFTRMKPYTGKSDEVIHTCVKTGQRPDTTLVAESCPDYMVSLMVRCWNQEPELRPSFQAILQEIGERCRSLQREIFHGKKEVRRKICEKHKGVNEMKRLHTDFWDSVEGPSFDDLNVSVDAPNSPHINELSVTPTDETCQTAAKENSVQPSSQRRYKFTLPKKELTDFDKKVREILQNPLYMEMVINGYADHLHLPAGVKELLSDPNLIEKYIDEDTEFKMELKQSSHGVLNNVHCLRCKDAQQKGVAMQREKQEDDVFRYMKYQPSRSNRDISEREKRQNERNRSMQTSSYAGRLFKSGIGQKAAKVLKEPYKLQEALNDVDTGAGEAEKFHIISPDILEALEDPVLMQILLGQDPQALDTFMRHYPELTMKLLAKNKTQYGQRRTSERKRNREQDRQNYTRDAFNPGDEVMRRMMSGMSGSRYDQMQDVLQNFLRTRQDETLDQLSRQMQQVLQRGADSRRHKEPDTGSYGADMRRVVPKINNKNTESPQDLARRAKTSTDAEIYPQRTSLIGERNGVGSINSARSNGNIKDDVRTVYNSAHQKIKGQSLPTVSKGETISEKSEHMKRQPLSLEASMDELSLEEPADGIILYSEVDRDTTGDRLGVTDTLKLLKKSSTIPNLRLKIMDELPIAGLNEFECIKYILSSFNYIFIFLTPNFNGDTLKKFQSQMCLLDAILTESGRVIPMMTEKNIPNMPLEFKMLKALAVWYLTSSDDNLKSMLMDSFTKTILTGREKGFMDKSQSSLGSGSNSNTSPNKGLIHLKGAGAVQLPEGSGEVKDKSILLPGKDSGETGAQGRSNKETGTKKDNSKEETENVESSAQSEQPGIHTITHQHSGGGKTKIRFTPGGKVPNVQVGDRNVMVIGADGDSLKSKSKPKKPKNVKLTESEKAIDKDDIDMVCSEIGKEWRQLCRRLGFSEGEIEQLRTDYFTSGVYEAMYQAIRRWMQRKPREATKKQLAELLHEMGRDDLATQLK